MIKRWIKKWLGITRLEREINESDEKPKSESMASMFHNMYFGLFRKSTISDRIKALENKNNDLINTISLMEKHLKIEKRHDSERTYYRRSHV